MSIFTLLVKSVFSRIKVPSFSPGVRENWETGDRSMHYAYKEADLRAGPP